MHKKGNIGQQCYNHPPCDKVYTSKIDVQHVARPLYLLSDLMVAIWWSCGMVG